MTVATKILMGSGAVDDSYKIEQSLIMEGSSAIYRTPSTTGNRRTWTLSVWAKRNSLGAWSNIVGGQRNSPASYVYFNPDNQIAINGYQSGVPTNFYTETTRVLRDVSAWYHIVVNWDTTQSTAANRMKIWVNGVQETSFDVLISPALNFQADFNLAGIPQYVGSDYSSSNRANGQLAEMHWLDGATKSPSDFGETSSDTGQWIPKEYTGGSYGTNGFYLPFKKQTYGYSVDFSNSNSSLSFTATSAFSLDADFTIEFWLNLQSYAVDNGWAPNVLRIGSTLIYVGGSANRTYALYAGGDKVSANGFPMDQWNHVAITRDGNLLQLYLNGTRTGATYHTDTFGASSGTSRIAAYDATSGNIQGNISNLRIVKGTAVYTGTSLTVPTANLTAISGTSLLCCQASSTTAKAAGPDLTAVGTPVAELYSPTVPVNFGIGADSSGAGNNHTVTNLFNSDVVTDSPTNNFATWNPVDLTTYFSLLEGNLKVIKTSNGANYIFGTMAVSTGKWYWEMTAHTEYNPQDMFFGIANADILRAASLHNNSAAKATGFLTYNDDGTYMLDAGSRQSYGATITDGVVLALALDLDNGTAKFYRNNSALASIDISSSALAGENVLPIFSGYYTGANWTFDFGQKGFTYTPPSGFKALSTANLPEPAIPLPSAQFNAIAYTGDGGLDVTGVGFRPDLVWAKSRSGYNHQLHDAVRGATAGALFSNSTTAQTSYQFDSFDSDGFTTDSGNITGINGSNDPMVAWNWKANGSGSTNNDGNQASSVSANQAAGFSIATFTGTGSYATYGHGLGVIPEVTLTKSRSASGDWYWVTTVIDGSVDYLVLNTTAAAANGSATASTSSVFYSNYPNNQTVVAYNFASKPGFSKIGVYTGNGSADGPFVNCGFKPAFVMVKRTDSTNDWVIYDNKRSPFNAIDKSIYANTNAAESNYSGGDFLSNGFKIRYTGGMLNANNGTYLYMAFADSPFKTANAR